MEHLDIPVQLSLGDRLLDSEPARHEPDDDLGLRGENGARSLVGLNLRARSLLVDAQDDE